MQAVGGERGGSDLHHAILPLLGEYLTMVAKQLLELVIDDTPLLLSASIEGHRLCITAQPGLQFPVRACTHTAALDHAIIAAYVLSKLLSGHKLLQQDG